MKMDVDIGVKYHIENWKSVKEMLKRFSFFDLIKLKMLSKLFMNNGLTFKKILENCLFRDRGKNETKKNK